MEPVAANDNKFEHFEPTVFEWEDPTKLPVRDWIYGRHLIRRHVSATIASGAVGKTLLKIVEALVLGCRTVPIERAGLACFDPQWPNLNFQWPVLIFEVVMRSEEVWQPGIFVHFGNDCGSRPKSMKCIQQNFGLSRRDQDMPTPTTRLFNSAGSGKARP
jgi:hypothetical protein